MLGFSFGEIMVLVLVGIVVVGPRKLPTLMRTAGQWIGKLRRMSTDLRAQSGIDDLIRHEGLEREIRELRALSRVNVIETLVSPVMGGAAGGSVVSARPQLPAKAAEPEEPLEPPLRAREYPVLGCDAYGAFDDEDTPGEEEEAEEEAKEEAEETAKEEAKETAASAEAGGGDKA